MEDDRHAVPGTNFLVDAFRPAELRQRRDTASAIYFLSHFHADHYGGLSESWNQGPIYCGPITARLVVEFLQVDSKYVHALAPDVQHEVAGHFVTPMDANHCPGALMYLFAVKQPDGSLLHHLHSGDCRFDPRMLAHPALKNVQISHLFLDTTYCDPKHAFPSQAESVEFIAKTIQDEMRQSQDQTLFLIATYAVGKEKVIFRVAELCQCKLVVSERKQKMLEMCELKADVDAILTTDHRQSAVHIVGWHELGQMAQGGWTFLPDYKMLHDMLDHYQGRFQKIFAFIPTGWTYVINQAHKKRLQQQRNKDSASGAAGGDGDTILHAVETKGKVSVYTVPYSEHSNYQELRAFVQGIRPAHVVPTVLPGGRNVSQTHRLRKITQHFVDLIDRNRANKDFISLLRRPGETKSASSRRPSGGEAADGGAAAAAGTALRRESLREISLIDDDADEDVDDANEQEVAGQDNDRQKLHDQPTTIDVTESEPEEDGSLPPETLSALATMKAVLGEEFDEDRARMVLRAEAGDAQRAINSYLDTADGPAAAAAKRAKTHKSPRLQSDADHRSTHEGAATTAAKRPAAAAAREQPDEWRGTGKASKASGKTPADRAATTKTSSAAKQQTTLTAWLSPKKPGGSAKAAGTSAQDVAALRISDDDAEGDSGEKGQSKPSVFPGQSQQVGPTLPLRHSLPGKRTQAATESAAASLAQPAAGEAAGMEAETKAGKSSAAARSTISAAAKAAAADADVPYLLLAEAFERIVQTKSRLIITQELAVVFQTVLARTVNPEGMSSAETLLATIYLCTNHIAPSHEGVELGIGESTVSNAISEATGASKAHMRALYKQTGDLGDVAHLARVNVKTLIAPKPLTILGVYKTLRQIAAMKGKGSLKQKQALVHKLLVSCRGPETRFLVRTLIANLRVGAVGRTTEVALSHAVVRHFDLPVSLEMAAQAVKDCYAQCPSWDIIVPALVSGGLDQMRRMCFIHPGIPVMPMLGKITRDIKDMASILQGKCFQAEYKYDGARAQIHVYAPDRLRSYAQVSMFSRHLENVTTRYPDALTSLLDSLLLDGCEAEPLDEQKLCISSCIVDAEIVAVDTQGNMLPFQTLMNRARKDVDEKEVTIRVQIYLFDLMQINGQSLLHVPFRYRDDLMRQTFKMLPVRLDFVKASRFEPGEDGEHDVEAVREVLTSAFAARCEGIMVKALGPTVAMAWDNTTRPPANALTQIMAAFPPPGNLPLHAGIVDFATVAKQAKARLERTTKLDPSSAAKKAKTAAATQVTASFASAAAALKADATALSTYQPSKRCENWLKVKKDYVEGMSDTLDLVVIGGWWGNGRKAGWFSPFLLACYNPETEELESVCKVMSGFSDAHYKEFTAFFQEEGRTLPTKKPYYAVAEAMTPSRWFEATEVWEIKGADLTISPVHQAARGLVESREDSGISLRFPRFIRRRPDKTPEEATTSQDIAAMYEAQMRTGGPLLRRQRETGGGAAAAAAAANGEAEDAEDDNEDAASEADHTRDEACDEEAED